MKHLLFAWLFAATGWTHAQTITHYEYWFDQNDDDASRTFVEVTALSPVIDLSNVIIDVSGLPVGPHRIHYRLKDSHGFWSSVLRRDFKRNHDGPHEIVALRYWSDPDATAPVDMTVVQLTPNVQYLELMDDILFCEWSTTGNTNVYFQLRDNHAQWSSVVSDSVDVDLVTGPPDQPVFIAPLFAPPLGTEQIYTIDSVPGAGAYEWTLPNGWTGASTDTSITVQVGNINDGSELCVRAINGCGESIPRCLEISTSIADGTTTASVGLYPNPTTGRFFLQLRATAQVTVFDAAGRQILKEQQLQGDPYTLDIGDAPSGIYTVRIIQEGQVVNHRLVLQH